MNNIYNQPEAQNKISEMKRELTRLKTQYKVDEVLERNWRGQ